MTLKSDLPSGVVFLTCLVYVVVVSEPRVRYVRQRFIGNRICRASSSHEPNPIQYLTAPVSSLTLR